MALFKIQIFTPMKYI